MTNTDNLIFNSNNQHYYQVTDTNYQSWTDATNEVSEPGYLVSLDNPSEITLLQESLNSTGEYWVGGDAGSVFGAALGESFIASPDANLSLPVIIEYDSAFDYYTGADYLDSAISTLLPDSLSYLWDTVSIEQPADNQYELSWQDSIKLTELFDVSDFLPDVEVEVKNPTFTITEADSGNSYGFAGNISVGEQDFNIDTSFTLENIEGVSNFSWDNIAFPQVSLSNVTSLLGGAVSGLDSFFGIDTTIDINISEDGAELAWDNDINLTSLFGLGGSLPDLIVDTPTFAIALEEDTTTYNVAGNVNVPGITAGLSSSFVQETLNDGSNEFSWQEIAIDGLSLNSVTNLLGNSISGFDSFFGNTSTTIDVTINPDSTELSWNNQINLTSLFGLGGFLPELSVDTPTFAIALEEDSTTYEFAGNIKLGSLEPFGLSSSFVQEEAEDGSSQFSWSEIEIAEFDLDNITGLLGDSFSAVDNFFDNNLPNLPKVTVGITEDEIELTLAENIDVSKLVGLDSFLPGLNLSIANPSFAIATEDNTNTYELAGDFSVLGETFNLSTSFTQESAGGALKWQELSIPNFSIGTLTGMMGGAFTQVDDVFGDALPEIDVTITQSELSFGSAIDFASSSNDYLQWIHNKLDIDTLDVDFIYDTSGSISLDAGVTGEFELVSTKDLDAFLTNVALSFDVDYSSSSVETSLSLEAGARLDIKDSAQTSLDLSGGISFEVGTGGFEAKGYFALDAGQDGWDNPFGLPDSSIRSFGLSLGIGGVTGLDSFGIRGDLQFGDFDFDAAFSIDLTNPDEFALAATLNTPISVLDLIAGPAASYALGQAANNVGFIEDATEIMNQVLDVEVVSTNTDEDPELEPLIYIVPQDTEIAGKLYEQGFSINAAVSAWGKDASLYFNANAETGEISGGLEIDKINIDVNDTTILKIEGSDFADDNGKGTIVGGTVTEADKYIDQGNDGTLVGNANVGGEANDGTLVGNANVSEEGNNGTLIDGTITDGALKLDGVNDYVKVASASELSLTDGTIEFRVTPDWAPGEKNYNPAVLANRDTTGTNYSIHIRRNLDGIDLWNGSQVGTVSYNFQQGVEYHVALVESGTNTEVFINGVSQGIMNRGFSGRQGLDFHIGSSNGTREFFEGTIDDVRVWNTVRSAAEISDNYQNTLTGEEAGLVAYWNFEEESVAGNTVKDVIANGVLNLDGSGDYVNITSDRLLNLSENSAFTLEAWINPDHDDNGYHGFIGSQGSNANERTPGMWIVGQTGIHFGFGDGSSWNGQRVNNVLTPNSWNHVATTFDGITYTLYVNGESVYSTDAFAGKTPYSSDQLTIGKVDNFFQGEMDEVRVWDIARSAAEISDNYQNSLTGKEAGLVAYWNFENESVEGNTVQDVTADGVLNLDGSGDYVNVTSDRLLNLSENSTFTLEAWINPDHDDNGFHGFIGSQGSNANERTPGMWIVGQTGIHFGFGEGSSNSWKGQTVGNVLTPDSWNHVATTFDGITYTLYVNGESVYSTDAFAGKTPYGSDSLTIGKIAGTYFQGEMDEVRVWDIARSAAEISDNYQNSLTGEEAGLVAYWNFENESIEGNTVQDVAENHLEFANSAPDGVLQLDDTDDYVDVSSDRTLDLSINKTFTLEAWINPDHDDNGYHGFIGSQGSNINERSPGMWVVNQTGITFGFGDGSSWTQQTANNVLTPDSWNHVATTFDGRTYTLYVNGETVYSTDAFAGKTPYGSDQLTIGQVAGSYFQGEIDEVRVWDIARSASQIETYFQQPLTGEERGLVGYWNFDGDSVNGDTVKDLAAGDDNLNLDFKLSDIDSYLRGDGKITFLGESIDVYVEAGSDGLEFAMATDNGTLTTDLAIVLDKSGFAASGSVDLDIDADINLPFGLGKISLVDLEVNTDASISVDQSGFASSFSGSLSINNTNISFDIDIDVAFSSVEDLYNKLEAKIIQEIKDSAKDIFSNVTEWANAIADGTVEFAGDVADVAVAAYDATEEAFIEAAETLGQTADDIASGLSNTYSATKDEVAGFLNNAGYASSAIADALISEFNSTATDITQALNSIGSTASDVATILDSKFTLTASQMASTLESSFDVGEDAMATILNNAGYASSAIADALISEFNSTATDITQALNSIGSTASDVATILDSKFTLTASQMASTLESSFDVGEDAMATILNNAGYASSAIADALISEFNSTATDITQALNSIGSTASDVATILDSKFTLTASQMTSTLESSFDVGEDAMAAILNNSGYASSAIADALISEFNSTATDITQALNSIGSTASDVATILDSKFTLTASQMTSTLESAFNVGTYSMANILKDVGYEINSIIGSLKSFYGSTTTPITGALKSAGYTINQIAASEVTTSAYWFTKGLRNVGYTVDQIASAFKDAGRGINFITDGLIGVYNYGADAITSTLFNAAYNASDVAEILGNKFNLTASQMTSTLESAFNVGTYSMTSILKDVGYEINSIIGSLKSFYGATTTPITGALKSAGYTINQIAASEVTTSAYWFTKGLRNVGYTVDEIASAFKSAGKSIDYITSGMKGVYNHTADTIASTLSKAGYSAKDVGNALDKAFDLTKTPMASALKNAGYEIDDVGKFLKQELGYSKSAVKDALKGAGFNGVNDWADKLWNKFKFW